MSAVEPDRSMVELSQDSFMAIAITSSRAHVLAALIEQAAEHFGGGPLLVTDVSVVACYDGALSTSFLAAANIARAQ